MPQSSCVVCSKRIKSVDNRRTLNGPSNKVLRKYISKYYVLQVKEDDVICGRCRLKCYKLSKAKNAAYVNDTSKRDNTVNEASTSQSQTVYSVPLKTPFSSHAQCFLCKKPGPKLVVVPSTSRYDAFIQTSILLPVGIRCCSSHLENNRFTTFAISCLKVMEKVKEGSKITDTELVSLLHFIINAAQQNKSKRLDFDGQDTLSDDDYHTLTGISKDQFNDLVGYVHNINNTKLRSPRTCLAIYLLKLRSGMSNKVLSSLFGVSKYIIRRSVKAARRCLRGTFVNENVGFQHITREKVINEHTRTIAKSLFATNDSCAILVLDGTYIYIQKSSNFKFQRRSFSLHKHRPLVKPMMIVSTTGYIVSVLGPYLADNKNNDANILTHIMKNNIEQIRNWVHKDDVFVVDRGFRDSVELLEDLGIQTEMPAFLSKGEKQHNTMEANSSRFVTKIRWVVESANSRIKQWKYLDKTLPNSQIPFIEDDIKIVCALCNKYRPPLSVDNAQNTDDLQLAAQMIGMSFAQNQLRERVVKDGLEKRNVKWEKMDGADVSFPVLKEQSLRDITLGVYQLKLAKSYTQEHLDDDGSYEILINSDINGTLHARLQSRHTSSLKYQLWIEHTEDRIVSWYCKCKAGARVVGTCAHVASVLWYLGLARHDDTLLNKGKDWSKYVQDCSLTPNDPDLIDGSDTDDSSTEE